MPPIPIISRMSSCGKSFASSAGIGGSKPGPRLEGVTTAVLVSKPAFIRHSGQMPCGASAGSAFPHPEHTLAVFILCLSTTYRRRIAARLQDFFIQVIRQMHHLDVAAGLL